MAPFAYRNSPLSAMHAPGRAPRRPGWYIGRGNDVFVPLIAADELPEHIELHGVSKTMNAMEIQQTGMLHSSEFIGEVIGDGSTFSMADGHSPSVGVGHRLDDTRLLPLVGDNGDLPDKHPKTLFSNPPRWPTETPGVSTSTQARSHERAPSSQVRPSLDSCSFSVFDFAPEQHLSTHISWAVPRRQCTVGSSPTSSAIGSRAKCSPQDLLHALDPDRGMRLHATRLLLQA